MKTKYCLKRGGLDCLRLDHRNSWIEKNHYKGKRMKTKISSLFVLVLVLFLSACGTSKQATQDPAATLPPVTDSSGIISEGRIEPIRFTQIALNANGLVSEVLAKEGDVVEAGQVIARLENDQTQTLEIAQANTLQKLTSAYEAVRDAQFKLDNFDVPTDFSGLTPPKAVSQTLEKLTTARAAYEPYKNLGSNSADRKEQKKHLDEAWSNYRKAIQWLDLKSTLETAQALLNQAQKDYDSLQDLSFAENTAGVRAALANAEVRAPFAGMITDINLKVGELAASGQSVVTVADLSNWVVKTTDLTELDVVNIKEGQPVTVILDAIPNVALKGNVLSISQTYSLKQADTVYEVTILLTDQNPDMRWGMTTTVKFEH